MRFKFFKKDVFQKLYMPSIYEMQVLSYNTENNALLQLYELHAFFEYTRSTS